MQRESGPNQQPLQPHLPSHNMSSSRNMSSRDGGGAANVTMSAQQSNTAVNASQSNNNLVYTAQNSHMQGRSASPLAAHSGQPETPHHSTPHPGNVNLPQRDAPPASYQPTQPVKGSKRDANYGRIISHRYLVEQRIGSGAFGTIYKGTKIHYLLYFIIFLLIFYVRQGLDNADACSHQDRAEIPQASATGVRSESVPAVGGLP